MKKILIILIAYSYLFLLSGCDSSSSNSNYIKREKYQHINGESIDFKLNTKERVLIGDGTINVEVYNLDNGEYIGSSSPWSNKELPNVYEKGNYRAYFYNSNDSYKNSYGILYYKSSGIKLKSLPINQELITKLGVTYLYKLSVSESNNFIIDSSNILTKIYDSNLYLYRHNNSTIKDDKYFNNTITLEKGDYYIELSPWGFKGGDGVFIMTTM